MKALLSLAVFCLTLTSCALTNKSLTIKERKVKISKNDPPKKCEELGEVTSLEGSPVLDQCGSSKAMYSCMRRNAHARGGNYVVIDILKGDALVGRLYKCPKRK